MYPVELIGGQLYVFTTLNGIKYYCRFVDCTNRISPVLGVYDIRILEIDFYPDHYNKNKKRKIFDEGVAPTLVGLMQAVLSPDIVLVAICDNSDIPGMLRKRLFNLWRLKYAKEVEMREVVFYSETIQDHVYGLIHTRKDFLYPEILENEISAHAIGIISEKFGG